MSVLMNKDNSELIVTCDCGCESSMHIKIDSCEDEIIFLDYCNGKFYAEQEEKIIRIILKKLRKIWAIIRNKDYHYADVIMTSEDWEEFKNFVNNH